ncbi:SusD/RagB family nutrient-binding outer membrane lipoprotein [Spirosoma linguale]|uniref:Lipoprotein n=1 Tax=Spirosoma linguale (strain ATCC 33905 / DSM 74 / LMG 10896 / Claus 1) TaxID=504472 RepID=D2QCF9_SPILD|nr:hypothetical protein Slin_0205 [Spirosoma linguale DSM 74]
MKTTYKALIAISLLSVMASCRESFFDINTTPNNPTVVPASVLLTTVEYDAAFTSTNDLNRINEVLTQHMAGVANQVAAYDVFNLRGASDNQWNGEIYAGMLTNAQRLIEQTQQTTPAYAGIAKILKAYGFSIATDVWGDVPYSEALQGLNVLTPRIDAQQDIYLGNSEKKIQSLFDLVKEGMADLDKPNTGVLPGADDVAYQGNLSRWKRLGNTLMLRLAIQMSRKAPAQAKQIITDILASPAGLINDNSLDFQVGFGTDNGKQNALYSFNYVNRTGDLMASQRFLDTLTAYNDPRISRFFTLAANTSRYVGFNNGATTAAPSVVANRSRYGVYLIGTGGEAPTRIITNFNRAFLLAEAVVSLGVAGDAQALYQEGIRASMLKAGVALTDVNDYFTKNPQIVTLSGDTQNRLRQILTQKWIANIGMGIESWNDFRRTGYPRLALPLNAQGDNPGVIPVRLPYTSNEQQRNPNVPNPGPRMDERLWWDVD